MNILEAIHKAAGERGLGFILIGGHAVNAHRFSRHTEDLDVLICEDDREEWYSIMQGKGYSLFHDGGNFMQLSPPEKTAWPVDFMLVKHETFDRMIADAVVVEVAGVEISVPSIPHLVAMKLHAINHGPPHREMGDLHDIIMMLRNNEIDIASDAMQDVFLKHGKPEQYEQVRKACGE